MQVLKRDGQWCRPIDITRSQKNTTIYHPLVTANRCTISASTKDNVSHVNTDTTNDQVSVYSSKPQHVRTTAQRNYFKPQRNVSRNCQLLSSDRK